jgi:hypothetical protein
MSDELQHTYQRFSRRSNDSIPDDVITIYCSWIKARKLIKNHVCSWCFISRSETSYVARKGRSKSDWLLPTYIDFVCLASFWHIMVFRLTYWGDTQTWPLQNICPRHVLFPSQTSATKPWTSKLFPQFRVRSNIFIRLHLLKKYQT